MNRELHHHQQAALAKLRQSLAGGRRRPMLQAPTGFGKTLLAAAIAEGARSKQNRVVFTVPALSLVDQTLQAFWEEGITEVGVIQGDHHLTNWARPIQIASVQTLMRRDLPKADVVMVDEAHRWFEFYGKWMALDQWRDVPFIGLSATPWTKGLGKFYDDLIVAASTADLIRDGFLSPFRVYAPSHPDLTGVRTVAGDYHEGDLSKAMDQTPLVADVVSTWKQLGHDRPTLCFGVDRAHARHLQQRFNAAGIPAEYIDAYTPNEERERIRLKFKTGLVKVVCNVACLTTGVDWDVRCIILARPTKSPMLFVQMIGRGLRVAEDKDDLLVLDHSDTHLRLGFVTDIDRGRLDDGKPKTRHNRERGPALPKECKGCGFVKPAQVHQCPACGFAPEKQTDIEHEEGELEEIRRRATMDEKRSWFGQLKGFALEKGYAPGWAAHKFRERFGVWPNKVKSIQPMTPSAEVRSWIKSRQIAFAKRKEKEKSRETAA